MGFSVSIAVSIFLVGFLILSSVAYTSLSNSMGLVSDGRKEQNDRMRDVLQTDINITNVSYGAGTIRVRVENTGSIVLDASKTDLLINGTFQTENISLSPTKVWIPEKTLNITVTGALGNPSRVKVISENGISDYWGA